MEQQKFEYYSVVSLVCCGTRSAAVTGKKLLGIYYMFMFKVPLVTLKL